MDQKVSDSAGDKMMENDTVRKGTDVEDRAGDCFNVKPLNRLWKYKRFFVCK